MAQSFWRKGAGSLLGLCFLPWHTYILSVNRGNARRGNAFERDIVAWVGSLLTSFLGVEQ